MARSTFLQVALVPEITDEYLNDGCPRRAPDWLYAHDPTRLFADIARQPRRAHGSNAYRSGHVSV